MQQADSILWVAGVTLVIWVGVFLYCLNLDRRLKKLEEQQ